MRGFVTWAAAAQLMAAAPTDIPTDRSPIGCSGDRLSKQSLQDVRTAMR